MEGHCKHRSACIFGFDNFLQGICARYRESLLHGGGDEAVLVAAAQQQLLQLGAALHQLALLRVDAHQT